MNHEEEPDRIKSLFVGALEREGSAREAFLAGECGADGELKRRVEALLRANEEAGGFLAEADGGDGVDPHDQVGEQPGRIVGRYKLLQEIGEGGFGIVWMAEQLEPVRRKVALKIIKLGMDTKQVVARFEAERQALALMDHPNIAKVLDGGVTAGGRPFFVMELVRGVPITEYCDEAKLSTRLRLDLFMQVCHAVQHAHQKGIIHRDIKPSNVMVTLHDGRPVPMVIDFGIAKATSGSLTEKTLFTEFRQFLGTPEYMSPEQAEISGLDVDTRTDIYSLGVLLYELLTGTTPLDSQTLRRAAYDEILRMIREVEPQRPSTRVSTLGERRLTVASARATEPGMLQRLMRGDLDWIVMKALEKERTRRYESAASLAQDVQRFLGHEPVVARPPSRAYKVSKFMRRNRTAVGAAAAILVALLAGTAAATIGFVRAERGRREALEAQQLARAAADEALAAEERARLEEERARQEADNATRAEASERAQRERAAAEAAAAAAINAFYDEMLFSIDPLRLRERSAFALDDVSLPTAEAHDRDVSVVEMLRGGAASVEEGFGDKPELEVKVRETIGITLLGLGRPDEAREQLDLAAELQGGLPGVDEADRLRLQLLRGMAASRAGADAEAEELIRAARDGMKRVHGARSPRTLHAGTLLGRVLSDRGEYAEAIALLEETLELQRHVLSSEHRDTIDTMVELANCYAWQTKPLEAEPIVREAYELATRLLAPDDVVRVGAESALGLILEFQMEFERAEELLRDVLARQERLLGPDHEQTAWTAHHLARCLKDPEDLPERERLMRAALAVVRRKLPGSPGLLVLVRDTALTLFQVGNDEEGLELMQEYGDGVLAVGGTTDPRAPDAFLMLRSAYERLGRAAEAEDAYRKYAEVRRETHGAEAIWTCSAYGDLCRFYLRSGDVDGALEAWQGCLDVRRRLAERPGARGGALHFYAGMLLRPMVPEARDAGGAIEYLERALEAGLAADARTQAWRDMALAYELSGRPDEAREAAQVAVEESRELAERGGSGAMLEHARFLLGADQWRDPAEARSFLEHALRARPDDDDALKLLYSVCWEVGDMEGARSALRRLIARRADVVAEHEWGVNNYLWSLVASEFDELRPRALVADLAERLEQQETELVRLNTLGVARYRLGELDAAVARLEEADRRNVALGQVHNPALDRLALVMCYQGQGRERRARELFEETVPFLEDPGLSYEERMELRSLQREAERLLASDAE